MTYKENLEIDHLIVTELKLAYDLNCTPTKIDCSWDCIEPDEQLLSAIDMVIRYYTTDNEYNYWIQTRKTPRKC